MSQTVGSAYTEHITIAHNPRHLSIAKATALNIVGPRPSTLSRPALAAPYPVAGMGSLKGRTSDASATLEHCQNQGRCKGSLSPRANRRDKSIPQMAPCRTYNYTFTQPSSSSSSASSAGESEATGHTCTHVAVASKRSRSASLSSLGSGSDSFESEDFLRAQDVYGHDEGEQIHGRFARTSGVEAAQQHSCYETHSGPSRPPGACHAMSLQHLMSSPSPTSPMPTAPMDHLVEKAAVREAYPRERAPSRHSSDDRTNIKDRPPRIAEVLTAAKTGKGRPRAASNSVTTTEKARALPGLDGTAKRRRVGRMPNSCADGSEAQRRSAFDQLFWQRQQWLMERRGADGMSHCSSDNEQSVEEQDGDGRTEVPMREVSSPSRAMSSADVMRTSGAGLPLARVKRVMKSSDTDIKMISHEAPSLLSRLCTVLIADLSMRAAYNAVSSQAIATSTTATSGNRRTTVTASDLRQVTIGDGAGSGSEWEFLRDVLEASGHAER